MDDARIEARGLNEYEPAIPEVPGFCVAGFRGGALLDATLSLTAS